MRHLSRKQFDMAIREEERVRMGRDRGYLMSGGYYGIYPGFYGGFYGGGYGYGNGSYSTVTDSGDQGSGSSGGDSGGSGGDGGGI